MYPAFYYATEEEFLISPSIFKLINLGVPAKIDWPALGAFLRIGSPGSRVVGYSNGRAVHSAQRKAH
jgi:hypothetical protein